MDPVDGILSPFPLKCPAKFVSIFKVKNKAGDDYLRK